MVPHFTGRQKEREEIAGHVTSGSTRIVSIWGSPGFGKTSVAIAVGHDLHSQGLPVYYISLRGLQSKADLASPFLSLFGRPAATGLQNQQRLSINHEVFRLFNKMSDSFALILDNADDLLSRGPEMKEDFTHFLEEILRRTKKVTFLISTRQSLEFMNVQFKGHHAVRIRSLDATSSQKLVHELLPNATASDCERVSQICAHVPLAMKIFCSSISEDNAELIQVVDDLKGSLDDHSIVEMLDNPDFPHNLRLKLLFDSSFQRLSAQEKEALVSLCVLPDSFDPTIAAAVLGLPQIPMAKIVLNNLRRKSLLESSAKPGSFLMHRLIRSFANQNGEHEMRETVLKSKARLREFNICRFQELNEKFLTGHSMSAFIDFYKDEQSITQSLIEGCSDPKTANRVFEVLVNAELFLYSVYWKEEFKFNKIYDSAIKMARKLKENVFYGQLLVSKALYHVTWSERGKTTDLLSEAKGIEASPSSVSTGDEGKHLCYSGINYLVKGETAAGVKSLEDALPSLSGTPERTVLRTIAFQILAIYYRFKSSDSPKLQWRYHNALQQCRKLENTQLLIIPGKRNTGKKVCEKGMTHVPLKVVVLSLVSEATLRLIDSDTRRSIGGVAQEIGKDIEKRPFKSSLGLFIFQRNADIILQHVLRKVAGDAVGVFKESTTSCHETELNQCKKTQSFQMVRRERTTKDRCSFGKTSVLSTSAELFKEQHSVLESTSGYHETVHKQTSSTADSYNLLVTTQHDNGNSSSAPQSPSCYETALNQCKRTQSFPTVKEESTASCVSFGNPARLSLDRLAEQSKEQRSRAADSYHSFGDKQHGKLKDGISVLRLTPQRAHIKQKLSGEQHSSTGDSYHLLGATQHKNGDSSSAPQSTQGAVDNKREIFREEHSNTVDTYDSLRATQPTQGNFSSALQFVQRTLKSRRELSGEEHASTAESYYSLGITQHAQGDFSSALQSAQHALEIRLKLFGEEKLCVADSYDLLSDTQHEQGELSSSLQSAQHALSIRCTLSGEEHSSTADSYQSVGDTQHAQGDFSQALQYKQRALGIRLKLFEEEHANIADSYDSIGDTQHAQGDFSSAFQSTKRALDIRLKLFGEDHASTAESYYSLGVTQHAQGDFAAALQSAKRGLKIRQKMFGEVHASTADSYHSVGIIRHSLGDFSAALQCKEHALDIRRELFKDRHPSIAESYDSLGDTHHALALQSEQLAHNIRLELSKYTHA